jgi:hypothetical protein
MTGSQNERNPAVPGSEAVHGLGVPEQSYRIRPRQGTASAEVLNALLQGRTLTSLDAWHEFGTSRLAAVVFHLKGMGWPILSIDTPVKCRKGRATHVATYSIDANAVRGAV